MRKFLTRACLALVLLLHSLPLRIDVVPPFIPPPPIKLDPTSAQCIATALWHEARGESLDGQRAVLDVILHRKLQSKKSACKVSAMPGQFPWFTGEWLGTTPKMRELLERVKAHPRILKDEKFQFFYSLTMLKKPPYWAAKMDCEEIGNHAFCKLKEGAT